MTGFLGTLQTTIDLALKQPWTRLYAKLLACVFCYGAIVHIGNIASLTGTPWLQTPLLWRSLDLVLLSFNLVAAIGLWRGLEWSVGLVFAGILLLQIVPYTIFRAQFIQQPEDAQLLNGLLGTEALLLLVFAVLIAFKK